MDKSLASRLESAVTRLERLLDRLAPPMAAGNSRSGDHAAAGEGAPGPSQDPSPQEIEQAAEFIEQAAWRAQETIRRWEQQGGPTEEDAEAYLNSWTVTRPGP